MKLALVRSPSYSDWQSCISITGNLARSYELVPGAKTKLFELSDSDPFATIHSIAKFRPDRVVVIDHGSFQPRFMSAWLDGGGRSLGIPIDLHCFGDFPLSAAEWFALAPEMLGLRLGFVAASAASSQLISLLVPQIPQVIPFPIDTRVFKFVPGEGPRLRKLLKIAPDELMILYTGRFSLQKNTTLLTRLVHQYSARSSRPITLAFAGRTDDIGADFLGIDFSPGFYQSLFHDELAKAARGSKLKIVMLGNQDPDGLRRAYNAADLFVSLSMHHDEDFGMSPAEALCSGTPVALTGWGGFHSFSACVSEKNRARAVRILRVSNAGENLSLSESQFHSILENTEARARFNRACTAREVAASLSIEAVGAALAARLGESPPPFLGFSEFFETLAKLNSIPARFQKKRFSDPNYLKLYSAYLAPTEVG